MSQGEGQIKGMNTKQNYARHINVSFHKKQVSDINVSFHNKHISYLHAFKCIRYQSREYKLHVQHRQLTVNFYRNTGPSSFKCTRYQSQEIQIMCTTSIPIPTVNFYRYTGPSSNSYSRVVAIVVMPLARKDQFGGKAFIITKVFIIAVQKLIANH